MRKHILKLFKWLLLIWGGFSFIAIIVFSIYVLHRYGIGSHDKVDSASPKDVRYVLNECHLNEKQIEQVVHSYTSAAEYMGDDLTIFAIKISNIDDKDFISTTNYPNEHWFRGDQLPQVVNDAVKLVGGRNATASWLPTTAELTNSNVYVFPEELYCCCGSLEPNMATLIFVRKTDRMVFYFELKR